VSLSSPGERRKGGSSVSDALSAAIEAFRAVGITEPETDAEVLLSGLTGIGRAELIAFGDRTISGPEARAFSEAVRRRLRREPVAYILGTRGFRYLEIAVDPRVLIPRPETEMLVELALEVDPSSVVEIGTGSGAVALAIAAELPTCRVVATDTSTEALEVARSNAVAAGVEGRVELLEGTWPQPGRYDLIVANLPYVPDGARLEPELASWEPPAALFGGPEGTEVIEAVLGGLPAAGIEGDVIGLEIGFDQGDAVAGMVERAGFGEVEVRRDLAGQPRVVVGRNAGTSGLE
jgi:release factor glutamine methyltransferase